MRKFLLALGLSALYFSPASAQRLRESCIGDRCAIYEGSRRVGSITRDSTGRYEIRDSRGNLKAKVSREHGTTRIEKDRWRR